MRKVIEAGYGDRLMLDYWAGDVPIYILTGALKGYEGKLAPDDPRSSQGCTFFVDGLCHLHDSGLKPLEGVHAHHANMDDPLNLHEWVSWQWDTDEGRELVDEWRTAYDVRGEAEPDSGSIFGLLSSMLGGW